MSFSVYFCLLLHKQTAVLTAEKLVFAASVKHDKYIHFKTILFHLVFS